MSLTHPEASRELEPPLSCKTSTENIRGYEIKINDHTTVVYRPDQPLPCGAKVWIETTEDVTIETSTGQIKVE